jgi:hypothetical protein
LTVRVAYCGGCNVYYDRAAVTREIARRLPDVSIVYDGETADFVAVLCGCASACLPHAHLRGRLGKLVMTAMADAPALYAAFSEAAEKTV